MSPKYSRFWQRGEILCSEARFAFMMRSGAVRCVTPAAGRTRTRLRDGENRCLVSAVGTVEGAAESLIDCWVGEYSPALLKTTQGLQSLLEIIRTTSIWARIEHLSARTMTHQKLNWETFIGRTSRRAGQTNSKFRGSQAALAVHEWLGSEDVTFSNPELRKNWINHEYFGCTIWYSPYPMGRIVLELFLSGAHCHEDKC